MGDQTGDGVQELGVAYWVLGNGFFDVVDGTVSGAVSVATSFDLRVMTNQDEGFQSFAKGDVDGDGLDDWLLGVPEADQLGLVDAGSAYLMRAPHPVVADADADAITVVRGEAGVQLGRSVALADVTGDGTRDLLIGAPGAAGDGAVYLYHGVPAGGVLTTVDADAVLFTGHPDAQVGWSLATANDANGDLVRDMVIGAPATYGANDASVYLLLGLGL